MYLYVTYVICRCRCIKHTLVYNSPNDQFWVSRQRLTCKNSNGQIANCNYFTARSKSSPRSLSNVKYLCFHRQFLYDIRITVLFCCVFFVYSYILCKLFQKTFAKFQPHEVLDETDKNSYRNGWLISWIEGASFLIDKFSLEKNFWSEIQIYDFSYLKEILKIETYGAMIIEKCRKM